MLPLLPISLAAAMYIGVLGLTARVSDVNIGKNLAIAFAPPELGRGGVLTRPRGAISAATLASACLKCGLVMEGAVRRVSGRTSGRDQEDCLGSCNDACTGLRDAPVVRARCICERDLIARLWRSRRCAGVPCILLGLKVRG